MRAEQFYQWCVNYTQNNEQDNFSPLIMGILNLTPDSFSDGNCYNTLDQALVRVEQMLAAGADIIDIGGESSRPGARPVSVNEELARVVPVIEQIVKRHDLCISIDTTKPEVMKAAIEAGAAVINDIFALRQNNALEVAAALQVPVCLMHMHGSPATMQKSPCSDEDILITINNFFTTRINHCISAGIKREYLILDPGFGFGKLVNHNLQIIKDIGSFKRYNLPILVGVSRKSTLGLILDKDVAERLIGGVTMAVFTVLQGAAIIRTHDVAATKEAFEVLKAIDHPNSMKGNG